MRHIILCSLLFIFTNCNRNDKQAVISSYQDSISVYLDSLANVKIPIPPLYDPAWTDSATVVKFFELASQTNGEIKVVSNAKYVTSAIKEIIGNAVSDKADILFLIDKTSSMADDIENVKLGLNQIIDEIRKYKNIRVGITLYGDKNADGDAWYAYRNFEYDYNALKKFITGIEVSDGGDYPESVYDGFFRFTKENFWRSENKRIIVLIGDAPPLEKPNSDYSIQEMIAKAKADNIQMNFYPIVVSPAIVDPEQSIEHKSAKLISSLFPNPAFNTVKIKFQKSATYQLQLYSGTGQLISSEEFTGDLWQRSVVQLTNGMYVLRAINSATKDFETIQFVVYK